MIDYHIHTARCCHATGKMEEYLAEACSHGLKEIGYADHFPLGLLGVVPRTQVTMNPSELEDYIADVEVLRSNSPGIKVKLGIEVDYIPGTEELLERLLKEFPFDYVIGSIHFMEEWDFTHPIYAGTYGERDIGQLYKQYFGLVRSLCKSGLFDIIGHLDVIKKFGYRPAYGLEQMWDEVAGILKETSTCFELNTAGRDAPVGDFYPDRSLLDACARQGVAVTLGSDAHSPDQVGRYFDEALSLLRDSGYNELTIFSNREQDKLAI